MNSKKPSFLRHAYGTIISAIIFSLLLPNYLVLAIETKLPTVDINGSTLLAPQNGTPVMSKNNKVQSLQNKKQNYVPGEVIIKFKTGAINLQKAQGATLSQLFANKKGLTIKENIKASNLSLLRIKGTDTVESVIERLKTDPDVESVQPNFQYYPLVTSGISTNDTYKDSLWGLDSQGQAVNSVTGAIDADIDAPEAWNLYNDSTITKGTSIVAVIDTGIAYNHPDLASSMWDGTNCKDDQGNSLGGCLHGYDFESSDKEPLPATSSHGTHIAGIIAAVKNNNKGVIGLSSESKIMALKTNLTTTQIVRAINFAKQNGAKIINASWGSYGSSSDFYDNTLYNTIKNFPGLFIAAAGNKSYNHDDSIDTHKSYPDGFKITTSVGPGLDNIIVVAATDQNDILASFSDYGISSVDVGAPGKNIYSTISGSNILSENFEGITPPNIPNNWAKLGILNNWGTFHFTSTNNNVVYGDLDYPYANNANNYIISPTVNLGSNGIKGATLSFYTSCDTEYLTNGWNDYMELEYSADGINFVSIDDPITNAKSFRWDEAQLDGINNDSNQSGGAWYYFDGILIPQEYLTSNFRLRFHWVTNSSDNNYDGCQIDDIKIVKYTDGSDEQYGYMNGTSMATPYVSGLASLLEMLNPNLTISRIKEIILSSGDPLNSLRLKTTTGKRINAENALLSAMPIPPKLEISSISSQENTAVAIISSTESTSDIMAGKINLKSSESDAVIKKLSFQYIVNDYDGILANESNIISAVKIYDGNTPLSTVAITGATGRGEIDFSNINIPIAKDTTKTLTIKADFLKREKEGNNVIFSIVKENTIVEDKNSIITTNDNISGSYSSTKVYAYTKAPTITLVSTSTAISPDTAMKEADATITLRIKAEGGDIYINDANDNMNNAMIYSVTDLGNESSAMSYTSTATHQNGYYIIKNGETQTITVSFHILSGDAGFYSVNLGKIKWGMNSTSSGLRSFYSNNLNYNTNSIVLAEGGYISTLPTTTTTSTTTTTVPPTTTTTTVPPPTTTTTTTVPPTTTTTSTTTTTVSPTTTTTVPVTTTTTTAPEPTPTTTTTTTTVPPPTTTTTTTVPPTTTTTSTTTTTTNPPPTTTTTTTAPEPPTTTTTTEPPVTTTTTTTTVPPTTTTTTEPPVTTTTTTVPPSTTTTTTVPTNVVTVTVDENKKDVTIDDDKETVINIPSTITDATLDVASLTNDDGVSTTAILPEIAINAITSISSDPVIVNIPNGVQVEAPVGWDGTINVPTIQSNSSVTATPESGYTSSVSSVIEIGYGNIKLVFDKAVRILIPDQANQYVGYSRNGIFTQITNTCSADSQIAGDALSAEGDCKIRVGNDLVIWTKHFTKFITYTQSAIQISSSSSGTSSGQRITPQGVVLGASTERKTLSELLIELKKLILEYKQTKGSIPKEWEKYLDNQSTVIASKISEIVRNLSFTLSGEDVKTLQQFLINQDKGEYAKKLKEAGATGSFGLITKSALIEYQNNVGIKPALGYFGRITKDYLKSIGY